MLHQNLIMRSFGNIKMRFFITIRERYKEQPWIKFQNSKRLITVPHIEFIGIHMETILDEPSCSTLQNAEWNVGKGTCYISQKHTHTQREGAIHTHAYCALVLREQ